MSSLFASVDQYITGLFNDEDDQLKAVVQSIIQHEIPPISISPTQGKLLHVLAKACKAGRILELGTLGGYSTIWMARALAPGGKLITLELEKKHADVAGENFKRCGLDDRVEIRLGKALDLLADMVKDKTEPFDMIFIDADKPPYTEYFQWSLQLSKPGTLIIADNVIREGAVLDKQLADEATRGAIRFNEFLASCAEVSATIFQTVGEKDHDGMAIAVVK